jgi:hypothetical protein
MTRHSIVLRAFRRCILRPMSSQIVCAYSVTAAGSFTAAELESRMAVVALDSDLLDLYGLGVTSDVTGNVGAAVTRTITLAMSPAFKAMCPDTGDQVSPMAGFMTEILQNAVLTPVVAALPIVA